VARGPGLGKPLDCDAARVYGAALAPFLLGEPASAFLADGSAVAVHQGTRIVR